jgi:hypothetical protein
MTKFYRAILLMSLILTLISPDIILGQTGKIRGRVTDKATGEPLPGVNVLIVQQILSSGAEVNLTQTLGAATDLEGYYFILNVPAGEYAVRASMVGFSPLIVKPVKVSIDRTVDLNFEMEEARIEVEQVVVVAEREVIKKDISSTQETIEPARLEQMPILRVDEFIGTLKGIEFQSNAQGNGLSFRGSSPRETSVFFDGVSLKDPRTENSYLGINSTSVREIQVQTGGFEAKYGGVRGGILNVITKEGQRNKYNFSFRTDITPANQKRHFGTDLWSDESWIYRVYADTSENGYAFRGAVGDSSVPSDFRNFKGWSKINGTTPDERALDSIQRWQLWKYQHPQYSYVNKPDLYFEGTFTGPIPSFLGGLASNTTFSLAFKYEDSQIAFPVGPRDNYVDYNGHLKLNTQLNSDMRLQLSGLYAKIESMNAGAFSNYNGALLGQTNSFGYLNSTEPSLRNAASLLGGGSFSQIFNKSRLQFYEQQFYLGGAKLTHTLSDKAFYTLDFNVTFNDQDLKPFAMDTSNTDQKVTFYSQAAKRNYSFYVPNYGSPNASTNHGYDLIGTFAMYGGTQKVDSSYANTYNLKGDLTAQLGRFHQIETGFQFNLADMLVYTGSWYQAQLSYTPDTWQYYKATPLEIGLYLQDKIEFEGMILKLGVRLDYFNPLKKGYEVSFPLDEDYPAFLDDVYNSLAGLPASYERWLLYRELLSNPPGWPEKETDGKLNFSPRLGVSFPVTESTKFYFNWGHFYQRPAVSFLYGTYVVSGGVAVPSPQLEMGQTISYEFGFEQMFLDQFLFNVTAYYKDLKNDPLPITYRNFYGDNNVTYYSPDQYSDIRGFEVRLEKQLGDFIRFYGMYDYMLKSSGQSGFSQLFEDRLKARNNELRSPRLFEPEPLPRANANVTLFTPAKFGPDLGEFFPLGGWSLNYFFTWEEGGRFLSNSEEPEEQKRIYIDIVDRWNADLRVAKGFNTSFGSMEIQLIVKNVHNLKWLTTGNMTQLQFDEYKTSLRTPDKGGDDKWGEYGKEHINTGWYEAPVFLNPRRFILGLRVNL